MYVNENAQRYPYAGWDQDGWNSANRRVWCWDELIAPYLSITLTQAQMDADGVTDVVPSAIAMFVCPSDPIAANQGGTPRSYALNAAIGGKWWGPSPAPAPFSAKTSDVLDAGGTLLVVECPVGDLFGRVEVSNCGEPADASYMIAGNPFLDNTITLNTPHTGLHPGDMMNFLFCDGHVQRLLPLDTDPRTYPAGAARLIQRVLVEFCNRSRHGRKSRIRFQLLWNRRGDVVARSQRLIRTPAGIISRRATILPNGKFAIMALY